ncbi:MAG: MBL fold metallo-hydrolase, partial [Burkholderiales bacterium]|nr:MBL fold metallo-hydrolase [Burkholderiales bacterium]
LMGKAKASGSARELFARNRGINLLAAARVALFGARDVCNTRLEDGRWVPTFPNARYVFSAIEHAHWDPATRPDAGSGVNENVYQDSVLPIVAAGRHVLAAGETAIDDWLRIEPAPGHTPGHVVVHAASTGAEAVFTGDAMHHPLQVHRPNWNSRFCELPDEARSTRRRLLERCCERHALLMPAHFGRPHFGYVERSGDAFRMAWSAVAG